MRKVISIDGELIERLLRWVTFVSWDLADHWADKMVEKIAWWREDDGTARYAIFCPYGKQRTGVDINWLEVSFEDYKAIKETRPEDEDGDLEKMLKITRFS